MFQPEDILNAPRDGRQSDRALAVALGVRRYFRASGIASVCELTLANGRRADIVGLGSDGTLHIVEVKSSAADYHADRKWPEYLDYCDRFYFACPPDIPLSLFPAETGLFVGDRYGAETIRPAPLRKVNAARRRTTLLAFARMAAYQLQLLDDPNLANGLG